MSFGEAIKSVFSKYATFSGRARRSEFWYFYLFNLLVTVGLNIVTKFVPSIKYLSLIYSLGILVPNLAVSVRRLHDIGKRGLTLLWFLVPSFIIVLLLTLMVTVFTTHNSESGSSTFIILYLVFAFILLALSILFIVWMARDSQPGENQWGPNPKEMPGNETQNLD